MADSKPSYLSTNAYNVQRDTTGGTGKGVVFKDKDGTIILTARDNSVSTESILTDIDGKTIGTIRKKLLALHATFELFDVNNTNIGKIVITSSFTGGEKLQLDDPNGKPIAIANGNFMAFNYTINTADGNNTIANITQGNSNQNSQNNQNNQSSQDDQQNNQSSQGNQDNQNNQQNQQQNQNPGWRGMMGQGMNAMQNKQNASYKIEIVDTSIDDQTRLFLLEFVVVVDSMMPGGSSHMRMGGMGGFGTGVIAGGLLGYGLGGGFGGIGN